MITNDCGHPAGERVWNQTLIHDDLILIYFEFVFFSFIFGVITYCSTNVTNSIHQGGNKTDWMYLGVWVFHHLRSIMQHISKTFRLPLDILLFILIARVYLYFLIYNVQIWLKWMLKIIRCYRAQIKSLEFDQR